MIQGAAARCATSDASREECRQKLQRRKEGPEVDHKPNAEGGGAHNKRYRLSPTIDERRLEGCFAVGQLGQNKMHLNAQQQGQVVLLKTPRPCDTFRSLEYPCQVPCTGHQAHTLQPR
ncbi:hypothetical protein LIA77_00377 [Sarocladium implicatum]|nr:hypothetical protein LIA77_00377 [Sarocladium implicatum]